ncbi:MAG: hypothetical protein ACLFR1_12525 [Spirochaetia bacterium]
MSLRHSFFNDMQLDHNASLVFEEMAAEADIKFVSRVRLARMIAAGYGWAVL